MIFPGSRAARGGFHQPPGPPGRARSRTGKSACHENPLPCCGRPRRFDRHPGDGTLVSARSNQPLSGRGSSCPLRPTAWLPFWSRDGTAPGGYFACGPLPASVGSVVRGRQGEVRHDRYREHSAGGSRSPASSTSGRKPQSDEQALMATAAETAVEVVDVEDDSPSFRWVAVLERD